MIKKPRVDWDYCFFIGGIIAGVAFVALFVRTPRWIGDGMLAEFLYSVFLAVFVTIGARSGVWLYARTTGRAEREFIAAAAARMKAKAEREKRTSEAAEFAERAKLYQQVAEFNDLKIRCERYETEVRVLRAELTRHAPATKTQILLCD